MKEKIAGKRGSWTKAAEFMIILSMLVLTGCAAVKLGTLPEPPSSGKLRVFVKAVSGNFGNKSAAESWTIPHEDFEKNTCQIAERYFLERGSYEIVSQNEVAIVTENEEIPGWQWSKDDWALTLEVGRRLYAEYVLIVKREYSRAISSVRVLLINLDTKKRFEVMPVILGGGFSEFIDMYKESFVTLFSKASKDLMETADRKSRVVSNELAVARKEILELTKEPEKGAGGERPVKEKAPVSQGKADLIDAGRNEKVAALEAKLSKLMESLTQLEEMKKQIEDQSKKSELMARDLAEREQREKTLLSKLEDGSKAAPVIVLTSPMEDSVEEVNFVKLSGVAEDEKGLKQLEIYVNDKRFMKGSDRGIRVVAGAITKRLEFMERVALEKGANQIRIRAVDSDGLFTEKTVTVRYVEKLKKIWAVVIGIDQYPNARQLKYAVNDAGLFYDHLVKRNQIPEGNVILLLNRDATLTKIRSALGTDLKNMAGKEDMVVIYFAGHGATERDAQSPDGDGLEKYLLPFDADLRDLYATALPMGELSRIFNRIRSERLIFIADACYSGASGGRTMGTGGTRASISDAFIDRIAGGKGRVIMTASGANEVSAEKDELQHGVFTYFLVEGLKGAADSDRDGVVTVDEVYNYVSKHVPSATAQEQHPVKKGAVQGNLILSITQ